MAVSSDQRQISGGSRRARRSSGASGSQKKQPPNASPTANPNRLRRARSSPACLTLFVSMRFILTQSRDVVGATWGVRPAYVEGALEL